MCLFGAQQYSNTYTARLVAIQMTVPVAVIRTIVKTLTASSTTVSVHKP